MPNIALAVITNETFAAGLLTTLASAMAVSDLSDFNLYIYHHKDQPIDRLIPQVHQLCEQFNFPRERLKILPLHLELFEQRCFTRYKHHLVYGKFIAATNSNEEKLIYLDVDTFVLDDLSKLTDTFPAHATCGAVLDSFNPTHGHDGYTLAGKTPEPSARYFNAGMIVFNPKQCKARNLVEQALETNALIGNSQFSDQTIFNILFKDEWVELPKKWNALTMPKYPAPFYTEDTITGIFHYVEKKKPWHQVTIDTPNLLWHIVAEQIGAPVPADVKNELHKTIQRLKWSKRFGLLALKNRRYRNKPPSPRKQKEHNALLKLIENMPAINAWLVKHGFEPASKALSLV